MPIHRCSRRGKSGYQWGSQKCYTGPGARAKAEKQAAAIRASGYVENARAGNPLNLDPTRTITLRRGFSRSLTLLFRRLLREIVALIVTEDAFGLRKDGVFTRNEGVLENAGKLTGGAWRTIRGVHVYIKGGVIVAGPSSMLGKGEKEAGGDSGHGSGSGATSTTGPVVRDKVKAGSHASGPAVDKFMAGLESGKHKSANHEEIGNALTRKDLNKAIYKKGDEIVGAVSYEVKGGKFLIHDMGSLEKGLGRKMIEDFQKVSGNIVAKNVRPEAVGFYEKLGFKRDPKNPGDMYIGDAPVGNANPTTNKRWAYTNQTEAVDQFEKWLQDQVNRLLLSPSEAERWKRYVARGFEKGANRAFDDLRRVKGRGKRPERFLNPERAGSFVEGQREQFLRQTLSKPSALEKLKQIQSQALSEVRGLSSDLVAKGRRMLSDGLTKSLSPREMAANLQKVLKVSKGRAETIAYTELVRAHAEGQLEALDQLGVTQVGVAIEWSTASNPCKACEPMKGVVLKISEARGMLPRHPRCRCAWVPANIGEDKAEKKLQKRSKTKIDQAMKKSRKEAGDDWEADTKIAKKRPTSEVFNCSCSTHELDFSNLLKELGLL